MTLSTLLLTFLLHRNKAKGLGDAGVMVDVASAGSRWSDLRGAGRFWPGAQDPWGPRPRMLGTPLGPTHAVLLAPGLASWPPVSFGRTKEMLVLWLLIKSFYLDSKQTKAEGRDDHKLISPLTGIPKSLAPASGAAHPRPGAQHK